MRPKTKRRLAILIVAVLILAGAVFVLRTITERQDHARRMAAREDGIRLFHQGEYAEAMQQLRVYIPRSERDAEALFAYAKSRRMVEEANRWHLFDAADHLVRVQAIDPDHEQATRLLLEIYVEIPQPTEAIATADRLLQRNPDDFDALYGKAAAMVWQQRYQDALPIAEHASTLDIRGLWLRFEILKAMRVPASEVLRQAQEEMQANPDDSRYELLMAFAHSYAAQQPDATPAVTRQHRDQAIGLLRAAASRPPTDPEFARQLVQALDSYSLVNEAQALLERTAAQADEPEIGRMLITRLWQNGAAAEVVRRLEGIDPHDPDAHHELLAFYALSLHDLLRTGEALAAAQALADRDNQPAAVAWGVALTAYFQKEQLSPREQIAQYRTALNRTPNNAVIRTWLGEAYDLLRESELAIEEWRRASRDMPGWAAPQILIARNLAKTGRAQQALDHAQEAFAKAPNQLPAAVTYALAFAARYEDQMTTDQQRHLLALVQSIQRQQQPDGEPLTLPLYVRLLAADGQREQAGQVLQQAMQRSTHLPHQILLELASVSHDHDLGLDRTLLDYTRDIYGLTPPLAMLNAVRRHSAGESNAALDDLRRASGQAANNTPQWQFAVAQFMDLIDHPEAAQNWVRLGEQYPENLGIQLAILRSATAVRDRQFARQTIERVRNLTGEEGIHWRLEHARWLLMNEQSTSDEIAAAVTQLYQLAQAYPQLVEPRRLYAIALQRIGEIETAIEQLQRVIELSPGAADSRLALAHLQFQQGRFNEARAQLDQLAQSRQLNDEMRHQTARLYADMGAHAPAIRVLEAGNLDASPLLLAELYRKQAQPQNADEIYRRLLAQPQPPVAVIQSAADFYAATGQLDQARQVLARIEELSLRPGQRELVLGDFHDRYGRPQEALSHLEAAAAAAPDQVQPWRQLVAFHIRHEQFDQAHAAAARALQAIPDRSEIQALKLQTAALADASQAGPEHLRPLIQELAQDPQNQAAVQALQVLQQASQQNLETLQILNRLRDVSRQHPRYFPLQRMLIRGYLTINRPEPAIEIAANAMRDFPNLAEPAMLSTQANAAARRYPQMLASAQIWRQRSLERPLQPDLAIAEAHLHLNEPARALRQLEPYLPDTSQRYDAEPRILLLQANALIRLARFDDASSLLLPLAQQESEWRLRYLTLAPLHRTPDDAQRWLTAIQAMVPDDAIPERVALARAWFDVARIHGSSEAFEHARQIAQPLASAQAPDPTSLLLVASIAHEQQDPAAAEAAYRRFLQLQPDHAVVKNNLAHLLAKREQYDEAQQLVQDAIRQAPGVAAFHDTLGQICLSTHQYDRAIQAFENARRLEPTHLEASVGLAEALLQADRRGRARDVVGELDRLIRSGSRLTPDLQQRFDTVRVALQEN